MFENLKSHIGSSLHSVGAFFKRPLKLQNGELKLGVANSKLVAKARSVERKNARRMRADLFSMLEQHPSSRELVRSLAVLEHTLQRKGFEGVERLPPKLLARALTDLERLVRDWSPIGLAELRSRLAVLVKNKPVQAEPPVTEGPASKISVYADLDSAQPTAVTEVEHAVFEAMERSWAGRVPTPAASAERQA